MGFNWDTLDSRYVTVPEDQTQFNNSDYQTWLIDAVSYQKLINNNNLAAYY